MVNSNVRVENECDAGGARFNGRIFSKSLLCESTRLNPH